MAQNPASKESIQKLYENMGSNFIELVPQLCSSVGSLESLEQIDEDECKNVESLNLWKILLKLHLFALLIDLDLSTFLRAYVRSTSDPENGCNLKYVNIITFEGYNYLFGFGKDKNNAIWQILKKLAKRINNKELIKDINDIEQQAIEFETSYAQSVDRNNRNLSIHYDSDPLKIYNFVSQTSKENEINKISAFIKIIAILFVFINKYIVKLSIPLICSTNNYDIDIWEKINYFPDKDKIKLNNIEDKIRSFGKQLDRIVAQCMRPKKMQEKLNLDDSFTERLQPLVKSINPSLHIIFIYLDLASAMRAYFSSEYYFEKQLNLRRINVIVYEGFKHIYGYTDDEHSKSFWQQNISSILKESTNTNQKDYSLSKIERELEALVADKGINNMHLRECSVHYRYKDRDNTIELFHALVQTHPLFEMNKALKLLRILPELIKLNNGSIGVVYNSEYENFLEMCTKFENKN